MSTLPFSSLSQRPAGPSDGPDACFESAGAKLYASLRDLSLNQPNLEILEDYMKIINCRWSIVPNENTGNSLEAHDRCEELLAAYTNITKEREPQIMMDVNNHAYFNVRAPPRTTNNTPEKSIESSFSKENYTVPRRKNTRAATASNSSCTSPTLARARPLAKCSLEEEPDLLALLQHAATLQAQNELIDECRAVLKRAGLDAVVSFLIHRGIADHHSAFPVALVALKIYHDLQRTAPESKAAFADGVRTFTNQLFHKYWRKGVQPSKDGIKAAIYAKRIHIASLIGSLFTLDILKVPDVQSCLNLMLDGAFDPERLCAIHTLISNASDKLCKMKHASFMYYFRERLRKYVPHRFHLGDASGALMQNIDSTIERWTVKLSINE